MPKSEALFELDVVRRPRLYFGHITIAAKPIMDQILTEEELLSSFEKYRKIVQGFESIYEMLPSYTEVFEEVEEPNYVSEAIFSYQAHTS